MFDLPPTLPDAQSLVPVDFVHSQRGFSKNNSLNKAGLNFQNKPQISDEQFASKRTFYLSQLTNQKGVAQSFSEPLKQDVAIPEETVSITGGIAQELTSKAMWGPVQAGLINDPKHTFAEIFYENVKALNKSEFRQLKGALDYIFSNPVSRKRFMELTEISEQDIEYARQNLDRSQFVFCKLMKLALSTSTQRRVSKQVGGLIQFIEETEQVNGALFNESFKFKILRGIPQQSELAWQRLQQQCGPGAQNCTSAYSQLVDLNNDGKLDTLDFELASKSLESFKSKTQ
jgi:hypothetical protein